jgi:uncharacterized metal-binding protein YceD (DUF177 family)
MRRDDLLDLNEVLQHPGKKLELDISTDLPEETEIELAKPLEGYLEAVSTGNLLLLSGKFEGAAIVECARCGGPLEVPVSFELEEQFPVEGVPSSYASQDYARVAPEDEPYELFEGNNLLTEVLLRQDFLIALPVQPLCQYGWDGPCPVATSRGTDRRDSNIKVENPLSEAMRMAQKRTEDRPN